MNTRRTILVAISIVVLVGLTLSASAQTVHTYQPGPASGKDANILSDAPSANEGGDHRLSVGHADGSTGKLRHSLIEFD